MWPDSSNGSLALLADHLLQQRNLWSTGHRSAACSKLYSISAGLEYTFEMKGEHN